LADTRQGRARVRDGRSTNSTPAGDRYLNVDEVGDRLGTGSRFVRRLVAERRIDFHKFGRHVRISESALDAFVASSKVEADR
jgi:excisionase family DNA binding protein